MNILHTIQALLKKCSITNSYSGLGEFRQLAEKNVPGIFEIGWAKLTTYPDLDEGLTVTRILKIMSDLRPQETRDHLVREWKHIDQEHRRAIIWAAHCDDVLQLTDWLRLFDDESSSVEDRRALMAALWDGYREEFGQYVREYLPKVGYYEDESRNESLRGFLQRIGKFYGIDSKE